MLTASPLDVSPAHLKKPQSRISTSTKPQSPKDIAQDWLDRFSNILSNGDFVRLADVFHEDSWWRDHVALDWDLRTIRGIDNISSYLRTQQPKAQMTSLALVDTGKYAPSTASPMEGLEWVQSMFTFKTASGNGKGMLRLVQSDSGTYKAHMLYTALQDLHAHPEAAGALRPHGGKNSLEDGIIKGNWFERRQRQFDFLDSEPQVLVIGAGQAGLNIAARLQALGVNCLVVDRNRRIGDNWRNRYRTLVTHDPVTYTHMAYLPFPQTWPLYTPKDKLGDWFEAYASMMELNVWTSTSVLDGEYDDDKRLWTVRLAREDGTERTLHPNQVVLATGHSGEPLMPSFPGQDEFQGTLYHGSQHRDASHQPSVAGKRVVVVGTGNSGHDIAQNFCEHGAHVTMLQRRGTYVLQAEKGGLMLHAGTYDESGPPTEDADVYSQSLPMPVQFALGVGLTEKIDEAERENIEGLKRAGFKLDFGEDGSGLFKKYMTRCVRSDMLSN